MECYGDLDLKKKKKKRGVLVAFLIAEILT